jgi:hypothetical protein
MAYYEIRCYAFFPYTLKMFELSCFQTTCIANNLTDFVSP